MLRREDRMPAHRRLPSIVRMIGGREPLSDEILRVAADDVKATLLDVSPVGVRQPEPAAELRPCQFLERRLKCHGFLLPPLLQYQILDF